jgi:hypothetical protein
MIESLDHTSVIPEAKVGFLETTLSHLRERHAEAGDEIFQTFLGQIKDKTSEGYPVTLYEGAKRQHISDSVLINETVESSNIRHPEVGSRFYWLFYKKPDGTTHHELTFMEMQ